MATSTGSIILHGWHRVAVYSTLILLFGSGLAWVLLHYFGIQQGLLGPVSSPFEYVSLQAHGVLAYAVVFFVGSLLQSHMSRAWRLRRNRASGLVFACLMLCLTMSGLALYYFVNEDTREWVSLLHWLIGLLLPALLAIHIVLGRRQRRRHS